MAQGGAQDLGYCHTCRPWKLTGVPLEPTGNGAQVSFAEDISAEENGQALGQRRHKRKRKKLLEKAAFEREKGELQSLSADGGRLAHTGLRGSGEVCSLS